MKVHKYYWEWYKKHKKESVFSYLRCWLFFETIFKENLIKLFKKENKLLNINSILDIWWWEWDKWFLLKEIIWNENIEVDVIEISNQRIKNWKKKFSNINFYECDMIKFKPNKKYDLITFFTSLMFIKTKNEVEKIIHKYSKYLNKWWYILIYETNKKTHFDWKRFDSKWFHWFNPKEIDEICNKYQLEKIITIKMYKKIFWKTIWYLTEKIWLRKTIYLDSIIPIINNNYWNFISLYKKNENSF